ncbi:MAG TPA: polyprenyl diphosphate synthase, partial [Paracoccaceae bacterium]|nr:polyprenyl diphosphate synthase [Paracoccaceae bacterium]
DRLHLTVAINYGGRDEITRATRRIAAAVKAGELAVEDIGPDTIERYLDTAGLPDPDLVLRTSGEYRVSGFLTWQSVYSEYSFVDVRWPDFTADMFAAEVRGFGRRERRFGAVAG